MDEKTIGNSYPKGLYVGMHSAIVNGYIVHDIPDRMVYVSQESELADFAGMPTGTFAATYGFTALWQKKPDGTWASV